MKTLPSRMKALAIALPLAGACMVGCLDDDDNGTGTSQFPQAANTASADVRGYADSTLRGTVTFKELGDSLLVQGSVSGLATGKQYAIHVHQFGDCSAPEASGEHFGAPLEPHGNPFDSLPDHHRGDLPNLQVDSGGVGHFEILTGAINLNSGSVPNGGPILDSNTAVDTLISGVARSVLGRSVVVHALPDDYMTQPAGGSDGRIGCGVIGLASGNGGNNTENGVHTTGNGVDTTGAGTTRAPADSIPVPVHTTNPDIPPGY